MISRETVFEVIKECVAEKGAKIPDGLEADFEAHLPEFNSLKTFNQVRMQLCRRIKKLLEDDGVLAEKYAEIYGQIFRSVRLKLVSLLGFQDYIAQPVYDGKSSRQILKEFLRTLDEGESWNMLKLSEWEINGDNVGDKLRTRIAAAAGPWNIELARLILAEEATELLKRNPLEKLEWRIRTIYDARRYLRMYLSTLPEGASWSYATLYEWIPPDGIDGVSVIMQIEKKTGDRGFTEDAVRTVLGKEADDLLKRNPFIRHIKQLDSRQKAKRALLDFMGSLDENASWSINAELYQWTSKDGIRGHNLYNWICRNLGGFSETEIREVLGEDADEALRRNPFTKTSKSNTDLTAASRNLENFLLGMPAGRVWSITDLQAHGQIGDGSQGNALHSWASRNLGAFNLATIKQMLGERAEELLTRNPFEVRHINRVVDVEAASKYLKKFLELWPAGVSWSPNDLQQFGEIDDGVYGYSVYGWINGHYESGFEEAALREILNGDADRLFLRSPFERKCVGKILTLEDFKKFFVVFLDCLPEGEHWTPSTLKQFGTRNC